VTRSRSGRGRNRSRAGRAGPAAAQEAVTGQVESETVTVSTADAPEAVASHHQTTDRPPRSPEPDGRPEDRAPSRSDRPPGRAPNRAGTPGRSPRDGMGDGSRGRNGQGAGRNQRRRPRPSQPEAMPNGILKPRAPVTLTLRPIEKRRVDQFVDENGPLFGCPMLTRTRIGLPVVGNHPAPRCSLGWALHSEDEALLCMYTEDVPACWKAHPENVERIRSKLLERETAAD